MILGVLSVAVGTILVAADSLPSWWPGLNVLFALLPLRYAVRRVLRRGLI